jgi:capsular exopolysaccharide synthesis family protein
MNAWNGTTLAIRFPLKGWTRKTSTANGHRSGSLVTVVNPGDPASEAYRALRTSLMYALVGAPLKMIVVTSPRFAEGKSTTCANLGVVLAQADKKTLILDCDFRKPTMHKIFGLRNVEGVTTALAEDRDLRELWQEVLPGLIVMTAGPIPPNPTEYLSSERFAELLGQAHERFDYVLVDVPPVEAVSDATIVAAQGDGVLLVLDSQGTTKKVARQAVRSLETVGANVLGTVLNNIKLSRAERSHYEYYGY